MITVANRTETAARIEYSFLHGLIGIEELSDPDYTCKIDSKTIKEIESKDYNIEAESVSSIGDKNDLTKDQRALLLRETVNTIGQVGKPGAEIRNIISVGMLSEGWDAKTVTHIMGLRAFSSQLLCEQVIGRGLRRTSYDVDEDTGLFSAEYVNIFGVPFSFLPQESDEGGTKTPKPQTQIHVRNDKVQYKIDWPNVIRTECILHDELSLDISNIDPLSLDASDSILRTELAPYLGDKIYSTESDKIDLTKVNEDEFRLQTIIFKAAAVLYEEDWSIKGTRNTLLVNCKNNRAIHRVSKNYNHSRIIRD
jgi:type III restriction enzyme